MIPCSVQGILWFEGHVKVTAIRFSPTSLSDRCRFEQRLRDYVRPMPFRSLFVIPAPICTGINSSRNPYLFVTPIPSAVRHKFIVILEHALSPELNH